MSLPRMDAAADRIPGTGEPTRGRTAESDRLAHAQARRLNLCRHETLHPCPRLLEPRTGRPSCGRTCGSNLPTRIYGSTERRHLRSHQRPSARRGHRRVAPHPGIRCRRDPSERAHSARSAEADRVRPSASRHPCRWTDAVRLPGQRKGTRRRPWEQVSTRNRSIPRDNRSGAAGHSICRTACCRCGRSAGP